ncbi:hypothetical protein MOA96_20440 [Bacillus spizizenii]|nr:hypothetical protein [Bacillus spizizenii]
MTIIKNYSLGDFGCIGTETEFILIIKNKIYGPWGNERFESVLNILEGVLEQPRKLVPLAE